MTHMSVGNYYNDNDPFVCAWGRELIKAGLIPEGDIDERPIQEVKPEDLRGYIQCHFFCGIFGWPLALQFAGFPAGRSVWSGSCPCPPFSQAGKKKACPACGGYPIPCPRWTGYFICTDCEHAWFADARHLWPEFWRLIRDVRPELVLGEQVAGNEGLTWLTGVRGSLERLGYAVGASDLPACSLGAPHIRHRLFWVANLPGSGRRRQGTAGEAGQRGADEPGRLCSTDGLAHTGGGELRGGRCAETGGETAGVSGETRAERIRPDAGPGSGILDPTGVGHGANPGSTQRRSQRSADRRGPGRGDEAPGEYAADRRLEYSASDGRDERGAEPDGRSTTGGCGPRGVANTDGREPGNPGVQPGGQQRLQPQGGGGDSTGRVGDTDGQRPRDATPADAQGTAGRRDGEPGPDGISLRPWDGFDVIACRDGKARRIPRGAQPGVQRMVDGLSDSVADLWPEISSLYPLAKAFPGRLALLRGYGNAINPQVAAVFIQAFLQAEQDLLRASND